MPGRRFRIGLPLKFIFLISIVIILTSLSLTWFFLKNQVVQIRGSLEDHCSTLARNLAYNSEYGVMTANTEFLQTLTKNVANEQDVIYAVVYDKNGNILACEESAIAKGVFSSIEPLANYSINPAETGAGTTTPGTEKDKNIIRLTFKASNGLPIHDVICPIMVQQMSGGREELFFMDDISQSTQKKKEEMMGYARVGISLARMNRQITAIKKGILLLTSLVVLFGIILSALMVRFIVRPIRELSLGTQKIASGDLDFQVRITSNDEIGDLADLFNQMAFDLKSYVKELNKEKEVLLNLKMALEQRTGELEETLVKMKNIQQELLRSEKFATIGRLASSVAHELRNPLASLKNISYYLVRLGTFSTDEKAKRMLEMLGTDVARANKIVTDLLDFSRVKKLNKVATPMDEFINKLLDNLTFSENVHITRDLKALQANIDPDRITQVLVNLVTNARDAMADKGGQITVTTFKKEDYIQILVADTGCGMDKETVDRIFEPLFTTKTKGLGLGLAIVKEIVEAHYGKITCLSEKGKGTTFEVLLPL